MKLELALNELTATELARRIERRHVTSTEVVAACLERVSLREQDVGAWEFIDPDLALEQARKLDSMTPAGPLWGVPIGVKDLIDTSDMPTTYGSEIYRGHRPERDAACVERLRRSGAVILGKTVTTEFAAVYESARTRNPLDPQRTPGGSSSGSAAAVTDWMVPAALGTQTAGSVLRPAAFCGIYGFKPTFGAFSRFGTKSVSPTLDTLGILSRSIDDLGLLGPVLYGYDPRDPATALQAAVDGTFTGSREPSSPGIGYVRTRHWAEADPYVRQGLDQLVDHLVGSGVAVEAFELATVFDGLIEASIVIFECEVAQSLASEYHEHRNQLKDSLAATIERGLKTPTDTYEAALGLATRCRAELATAFSRFDALLTPCVRGEAPVGDSTGDPLFCRGWTLLGCPTIAAPWLKGPHGMPVAAQLVGRHYRDGELLGAAAWLANRLRVAR